MEWVRVGDPGNRADFELKKDGTTGYGAVDYVYRLGKYEVTNLQYANFLNAVARTDTYQLYDKYMGIRVDGGITQSGIEGEYAYATKANMANKPVNFVSWFDTARFANWLNNGQPVGMQDAETTEDGAYTFTGFESIGSRNPDAQIFLPNENEWQKAAFYEPGALTANGDEYWSFPTQSDVIPLPAIADAAGNIVNPGPNVVNYSQAANWNGSVKGNATTVGSAGNESYYGAADMGGNVFEWVEADPSKPDPFEAGLYIVRGSGFASGWTHLHSSERNNTGNGNHTHNHSNLQVGFRVAATASPFTADFDIDIDVDGNDLAEWKRTFGITGDIDIDVDKDGDLDGADFLAWQQQFVSNSPAEWSSVFGKVTDADFDRDGDFDGSDFLAMQRSSKTIGSGFSDWQDFFGVTADADIDQDFDGADFLAWQRQFTPNSPAKWQSFFGVTAAADTDFDGDSDGIDFLAWQRQYTGSPSLQPEVQAVPEPAASILLLGLSVSWLCVRQSSVLRAGVADVFLRVESGHADSPLLNGCTKHSNQIHQH